MRAPARHGKVARPPNAPAMAMTPLTLLLLLAGAVVGAAAAYLALRPAHAARKLAGYILAE